ncbi:hypothetical protein AN639_12055 [Candidatus Epulonipiscium fishelsonii]|nr:hypothetical protein AN639_12055 [Epulopiscium sp. SCG-B05WGA-EpuloA1]
MKNAVVFDLDGTLINTLDSLLISVNTTLDRLHLGSITKNNCRDFIGSGAKELVKKSIVEAQGNCSDELLEKTMIVYKEVFKEFCTYNVVPYEGILNLLKDLKAKGFKLAVLSNKPHPSGLIYTMQQIGSTNAETLYVGDSEVDMETGLAASVDTVGVTWGFRERDVIAKMQPSKIVDNTKELLDYIYSL